MKCIQIEYLYDYKEMHTRFLSYQISFMKCIHISFIQRLHIAHKFLKKERQRPHYLRWVAGVAKGAVIGGQAAFYRETTQLCELLLPPKIVRRRSVFVGGRLLRRSGLRRRCGAERMRIMRYRFSLDRIGML